jgi:hypothetical protein
VVGSIGSSCGFALSRDSFLDAAHGGRMLRTGCGSDVRNLDVKDEAPLLASNGFRQTQSFLESSSKGTQNAKGSKHKKGCKRDLGDKKGKGSKKEKGLLLQAVSLCGGKDPIHSRGIKGSNLVDTEFCFEIDVRWPIL